MSGDLTQPNPHDVARPDRRAEGIDLGTAIVSYMEPHPGQALEFNRWYERDHFPAAVTAGPGVFSGARYVATRACKELRPNGTLFGDPARGSYLSLAWLLPGMQDAWDAFILEAMPRLRAENRMFAGRDHLHTAVYRPWFSCHPTGTAPTATALDHGYAGVIMFAALGDLTEMGRDMTTLSSGDVTLLVGLERERLILSIDPVEHHALVLAFCETDPIAAWARVAPTLDNPAWKVGFASPFLRTIPGTDTYVDEL